MSARRKLRALQEQWSAPSVNSVTSELEGYLDNRTVPRLEAGLADLRRVVADQGDAAEQVAEALGRSLRQISDELAAMALALDQVRDRLDRQA